MRPFDVRHLMSDLGLTHVALPVRSLAASVAFYAKYASMQTVHQRHGVVWVSDRTRPFALVLIETSSEIKPLLPMAHLGVGVRSREDVDRLCRLARDDGCLLREPEDSGPPVGYWALIRDPDGHTLEVAHGQELGSAVERGA
jgi:catechol 2,3-dioxygenase-like lactoylglutathione lyase family enzyme